MTGGLWTPTETKWEVYDAKGDVVATFEAPLVTFDGGALVFRKTDGTVISALAKWDLLERVDDEDPTRA